MKRPVYNAFKSLLFNRGHFLAAIIVRFPRLITNDALYLKILYRLEFKRKLDLNNPITYSEKLQWLKLYYHNPIHTIMADKYVVKQYVKDIIGEEYIIPTLHVWNNTEDIEWDKLPHKFVLKTTHDSGNFGVIICKDKSKLDISSVEKRLRKSLNRNTFQIGREWPYKNIKPQIIAEEFLENNNADELKDYKFFCFNGKVKAICVVSGRNSVHGACVDFFDVNYNQLPFRTLYKNSTIIPKKPKLLQEMIDVSAKLSQGVPHVRVDLYEVNGKIYFGEYTFFTSGGLSPFRPEEYDYQFGEWLTLPDKMI